MTREDFNHALRDALYRDTRAGHMLPWRIVAALADALYRRLILDGTFPQQSSSKGLSHPYI